MGRLAGHVWTSSNLEASEAFFLCCLMEEVGVPLRHIHSLDGTKKHPECDSWKFFLTNSSTVFLRLSEHHLTSSEASHQESLILFLELRRFLLRSWLPATSTSSKVPCYVRGFLLRSIPCQELLYNSFLRI